MNNAQQHSNVRTQQEQQTQTKQKERQKTAPSHTKKCRRCGAEVDQNAEFCPHCGAKLVDYCTFCGAPMSPTETVCDECGMPVEGVKCPNCGTLNVRSFCRHCNTPLTKAALRAIEKAKQDPKVQKAAAMMDKAAELEEKIERLKTRPAQRVVTETERTMMAILGLSQEAAQPAETTESVEEVMKEYDQVVKDLNAILDELAPPNGSTPQEQFCFYSARKEAIQLTRKVIRKTVQRQPTEWVCNYCGCHHRQPSECVEPWQGGTWIYKNVYVDTEVEETYTIYQ